MEDISVIKKNYIDYIDKIIKNNKLSHAYIIEVDDYYKDSTYIYDFIKMILLDEDYKSMKKSNNQIIELVDNNNYPDIKIIETDTSTIKKSQMIELQKEFSNTSLLDGKRIYIIKEAEKLNPASANTMLKFLEEPEDNIIAILVTNNRYKIINTLISRCQILTLKENIVPIIEDDGLIDLLKSLLNPKQFFIKYNYFINDVIPDKDIAKDKISIIESIIIHYLNDKYATDNEFDKKLLNIFKNIEDKKLLNTISILEEEIKKLEFNVNYKLWIDSLISKLIIGG